MESLIESEMQNIDVESPQDAEDMSLDYPFESRKGSDVINMAYGEGDFEIEDNDEKILLQNQVASDERDQ